MKKYIAVSAISLLICAFLAPSTGHAQFSLSFGIEFRVGFAPPPLIVYEQPPLPGPGYIWTPGYWAWDEEYEDYYWVPGTWVRAPRPGFLWTPGYWSFLDDEYVFYPGYWGRIVGFYGGINYGFGYSGFGYSGGRWRNNHFFYNRTVNNITNVTNITNINYYNGPAARTQAVGASFNGQGGVQVRATPEQLRETKIAQASALRPVAEQIAQKKEAARMPGMRAEKNHGKPAIAATRTPDNFKEAVVKPKFAGTYIPSPNKAKRERSTKETVVPRETLPAERTRPLERIPPTDREPSTGWRMMPQKMRPSERAPMPVRRAPAPERVPMPRRALPVPPRMQPPPSAQPRPETRQRPEHNNPQRPPHERKRPND